MTMLAPRERQRGHFSGAATSAIGCACHADAALVRIVTSDDRGGSSVFGLREVESLEADGGHVVVHTVEGYSGRLRCTLTVLCDRLAAYGFVRIHRGAAVNPVAISGIRREGRQSLMLLRSGRELPIGRTEFTELRRFWQPGVIHLQAAPPLATPASGEEAACE
jgi:DNA-binding LytR/AlgR family response regulator